MIILKIQNKPPTKLQMKTLNKFTFLILTCLFTLSAGAQEVSKSVPGNIRLLFGDRVLTLNFKAHPELLVQSPKHFFRFNDQRIPLDLDQNLPFASSIPLETEFVTEIAPKSLEKYFQTTSILGNKNQKNMIEITQNKNGYINISGRPTSGNFSVDMDRLVELINTAILEQNKFVRVPAKKVYAEVVADQDLAKKGIREIVAIGKSNFEGSSDARIQNILAGARKFDGTLIKRGGTFSFNHILKSVEEKDGFVKELVIKGNDTEKELGGGVCQVSTTVFRAAFSAGLPIVERRNHSYAVPYYKPHGLDATIYLGGQDFRFKNDTPGDLLVQSFAQGNDLYFVFYGTRDDRSVAFEGPFISEYRKAPEPDIIETVELPEGELVEASSAHDGFRAEWVRRIRKDGEKTEESWASTYRPWAAKILRGTGPEAVAEDHLSLPQEIASE